ncbi:MAG TPA: PLP-dependent lyase/thiolase, partial [Candidatus Margulisiibacteriota bacterium]|nr:PLP-dependent lyase/thiolase [Candidatus Margulisiibacteriota bacterium]
RGDPRDNKPGQRIVIPEHPAQIAAVDIDLERVRRLYLQRAIESLPTAASMSAIDLDFLAAETRTSRAYVQESIDELRRTSG